MKCKICGQESNNKESMNYLEGSGYYLCNNCYEKYKMYPMYEKINDELNTIARPTWEDMYFEIAKVVSKRSEDPHTKVGAVIVKNGVVVGTGYNGAPRNYRGSFNWNSEEKYDYVIHAELNAISNAQSVGVSVVGADIYLTLSPCHDCIKLLIQNQIKRVFYLKEYKDIELTKKIADNSDIELIKWTL